MQKSFGTIRAYHEGDPAIRVENTEIQGVRISRLAEGAGDVQFARTDRHGLVLTLDGSARHLTQMDGIDDATPSQPGEVCLIPQGLPVRLAWKNRAAVQHSVMLEFDDSLFETFAPEVLTGRFARGHLIPANFAERPVLAGLLRLAATETDPATRRGPLFAEGVLRLVALDLAQTAWTAPESPGVGQQGADQRVRRAIDYVEAFYARPIGLIDIAAAAGLSPGQLTLLFRRETGLSPYAYVVDRRLRQAVRLLRDTDLPIAFIAHDCGFADQQHLTRAFRSRLGTTPAAVRRG